MLKGSSFLVSRDLPNAREEEIKWECNGFAVFENEKQKQGEHNYESSSLIPHIGLDASLNVLLRCSRSHYGSIALVNKRFRSLINSGYLYQLRREAGIAEHWVYFSCDIPEWEAFDPVQCRWMRLPTITRNECFMYSDKESLAVGTQLLVFGREIPGHVIYKYSILTNSWTYGTRTITPRCLFASASLGEIAIVAGGCDSTGNILGSAELYESNKGTWHTLPSMNTPRKMCSGVFMDGKFYAIGGVGVDAAGLCNPEAITSGEVYDLKTNTWVEIPDMFPKQIRGMSNDSPVTSKAPPLLAVVKNELYAAYHEVQELWKYNKQKNAWKKIGNLPEQTGSINGWGMAFRGCGNLLVVIGGRRGCVTGGFVEINAWEPTEGAVPQWTLLGKKHSGSFVYNCAVMSC